MDLEGITPLVLTYNEEANIRRLLERLRWARRVVVVDSESTDATGAIVTEFANAVFVVRQFDVLARQWQFGLAETGIDTEWVLALDADYGLPAGFVEELAALTPARSDSGYRAGFRYCIEGRPLRGTLYPPVTVLFRRTRAHYLQDGHAHRVAVEGNIVTLSTKLLHDDRKPLERWLWSQSKYMALEAKKLHSSRMSKLGLPDRVRKLVVVAPLAVLLYCLFVKGNILDGRHGWVYALERATAESILSLYLLRAMLKPETTGFGP